MGHHGRRLAPERELAAPARGKDEPLQQRTGDDEIEPGPLGVLVEARGGVEDVADEDDLLPEVAELITISPSSACAARRAAMLVVRPEAGVGPAGARAALDLGRAEERGPGVDPHVHGQRVEAVGQLGADLAGPPVDGAGRRHRRAGVRELKNVETPLRLDRLR